MTDLHNAKQLMLDVVGSCVDVNATVSDSQVRGALWVNCIVDLQDKLVTVVEKIYDMGVCDGQGGRQSRIDEEKETLREQLSELGFKPSELQWKWRYDPPPFPGIPEKFSGPEHDAYMAWLREAEFAILDALVNEGGATAWCGDGSSCAAQIVETVARMKQE